MKRSRFSEEQIAYALRLAESGTPVVDVCRQIGVSEATSYTWKKSFGALGALGAQACARTTVLSMRTFSISTLTEPIAGIFSPSARVKLVVASYMQQTAVFLREPNAP